LPLTQVQRRWVWLGSLALAACDPRAEVESGRAEHEVIPSSVGQPSNDSLRAATIAAVQASADASYAFERVGEDFYASNAAQSFSTEVSELGVALYAEDGAWSWSFALTGVACDGSRRPPSAGQLIASNNRVELVREDLVEWYVNGPLGIEQGFVVDGSAACGGELQLLFSHGSELSAGPSGDGKSVQLTDAAGRVALQYTDLFVHDAWGSAVPARFVVSDGTVSITIDAHGAVFPIHIDPLIATQQAKLAVSSGTPDRFGRAVALSDDTALVGAYIEGPPWSSGAAYVFVRSGDVWTQQAELVASDAADSDYFGLKVALSGDTAIVGAPFEETSPGSNTGAVYVFVRNGSTWTEQAKLVASDGDFDDRFGEALSLDGDTALIGALWDEAPETYSGSAYVFVRNGVTWTEQAKLTPSDAESGDFFGVSVSLSGDTALIGADYDDTAFLERHGSAYVFVRNGSLWSEQAKLTASDAGNQDEFGYAVSLSGDTALIGARHDDAPSVDSGSAYLFTRTGASWTEQTKLLPSDGALNERFGQSVALLGDTAVVGKHQQAAVSQESGAAYVFLRSSGAWVEVAKLNPADQAQGDSFGISVALIDGAAIVGASHEQTLVEPSGAAYVFSLERTDGDPCGNDAQCVSGFCVDDVCCDEICDGGPCDACSVAQGAVSDGACAPLNDRACDDGNACSETDVCLDGACIGSNAAPDGTSCDDDDAAPSSGPARKAFARGSHPSCAPRSISVTSLENATRWRVAPIR